MAIDASDSAIAGGSSFRSNRLTLLWVFLASLAVRVVFLGIAPNNTTDAWSRYRDAAGWLQHPGILPRVTLEGAWLPFHIWLLGAVLWITNSEMSLRIFTVLLGTATILFYWGIVERAFGARVALASSLLLALFGFHIAYSVTTGSEVPTIFFIAAGIYAWLRFVSQADWPWGILSAAMFGMASLCRFEAWICAPILAIMVLDWGDRQSSFLVQKDLLRRALGFGLLASVPAIGWMIFSFLRWGDPLMLPHRTIEINRHAGPAILHHSILFRLFTVPASLALSLSPLVLGLAVVGLVITFSPRLRPARSLAALALSLLAFNYWNSIRYEVTQARYTLLYAWLLIPFAFQGLLWLGERWTWMKSRLAFAVVVGLFILWQAGIIAGAAFAPTRVADRLGAMSPTVPLHREERALTDWLLANHPPSAAVILDDFNWESVAIARFARLDLARTFRITPAYYSDGALMRQQLERFVNDQHPALLVCSPYGPIGGIWPAEDGEQLNVQNTVLHLQLQWRGERWRVYAVTYGK